VKSIYAVAAVVVTDTYLQAGVLTAPSYDDLVYSYLDTSPTTALVHDTTQQLQFNITNSTTKQEHK